MMQLDRLTLGRMAEELGFVRDTLEKICRLADVLKFMESEELLSKGIALKGGTDVDFMVCLEVGGGILLRMNFLVGSTGTTQNSNFYYPLITCM